MNEGETLRQATKNVVSKTENLKVRRPWEVPLFVPLVEIIKERGIKFRPLKTIQQAIRLRRTALDQLQQEG